MEVLIAVCLWGLLVGLILRAFSVIGKRNSMAQWPPEVVDNGGIEFEEANLVPVKLNPIPERSMMEFREAGRRAQERIDRHRRKQEELFRKHKQEVEENELFFKADFLSALRQRREERGLEMLAYWFNRSQDGNSPYAIGRGN